MRKIKTLWLAALFMIVLVLMLPFAFAQNMSDLNQTVAAGMLSLDVDVPLFSKDKYLTISGSTAPNARLEVYIGPTKVKVARAGSNGAFEISRIPLIQKGENDLLVKAMVEGSEVQDTFRVLYDPVPPDLTLSEIPEFVTQTSIDVSGDVTEPVTIKYASYPKKDDDAPDIVSGLEPRDIRDNQVTLVWTPSVAPDLLEYAVYRDGRRIGVARSAIFVDNNVAGGKEYEYQVSAVDTSCNEGVKSAVQKVVTSPGGDGVEDVEPVALSCRPSYQSFDTAVPFDITLSLQAGRNIVEILASDAAGNVAKIKKTVTVDVGPPQFIQTNLESIGTVYIPEVNVRGNLSEQGTVFVYVNDETEPSHFGLTDENGGFDIPVALKQDVKVEAGSAAELDTGVGWSNKIKLKAVDLAGQEVWYPSQQSFVEVIYAICGYGSWMDFDVEEMTPNRLTPRLLMQGIQQIGVPFTLTYIGGQDSAEIPVTSVNAVPVRLSPDLEDAFDNDKIRAPMVFLKQRPGQNNVWDGFVKIDFAEWPVGQLDLGGNQTPGAVEAAISDWRRGGEEFHQAGVSQRGVYLKPGCLNPALGCVKLYLEIDIPIKEKVRIYDPQTMQERFEYKQVRQRNCLPIIMEIDQVIPPDVIRKDSLEATSNFFADAIELIDKILDPLATLTENMVYLCLGSSAALFLAGIYKRGLCSRIVMGKTVDPALAEAGLCKMAYGDTEYYAKCNRCENAMRDYTNVVQDVYQPVCDRISCPSAPTIQKYIREKKRAVKDITSNVNALDPTKAAEIKKAWGVNGKVFSGNSCGFFPDYLSTGYTVTKQNKEGEACVTNEDCGPNLVCSMGVCGVYRPASEPVVYGPPAFTGSVVQDVVGAFATGSAVAGQTTPAEPTATTTSAGAAAGSNTVCGIDITQSPLNAAGKKIGIKEIYNIYKGDYEKIKTLCTNSTIHPACPLCCGYEYMWEWNSACGVGNFLGTASDVGINVDTFNEIKESTKLAAEKVGRGSEFGGTIFDIFNAFSGFCTSAGSPVPDVVRTGLTFNPAIQEAEDNLMQVFVFPDTTAEGESFKYRVYRGYLAKTFVIDNAVQEGELEIKTKDRYSFSKTLEAVTEKDLTKYFHNLGTAKEAADKASFAADLCAPFEGTKGFSGRNCRTVAPGVFDDVKSHIGAVEDEYIIRPDASIITSVRCICLSAVVAYLKQWRQIAQAIKNCVDVIRLTGDGDEGMCRSLLSTYVCDLLWEVITCFANKWNAPSGKRIGAELGVGELLGVLTGAGSDVANSVEGRYGETAMFNAMFNEKEIVHGLCLLAFGLEWNLDAQAMVQQSVESVPVDTVVLGPTPAQSRFIAWNPATSPRGLTTWEYHFGLMISAGADINTRVKLKCSTGFDCRETDGFVGGECDCNQLGEEKIVPVNPVCTPAWKNRVNKNELMSYDCSHVVQQGKYRFDTIIFEYEWQDPGTKEMIKKTSEAPLNRVGATPPAFCRFDAFSLAFRCKFGEEPGGIKFEKIEPLYEYSSNNVDVFAMDEALDFELSIRQMMPETQAEMDSGIKFLGYKILNSAGAVVAERDPLVGSSFTTELKTDGQYKKEVSVTDVWRDKFAKAGITGERYDITVWSDNIPLMNKIKVDERRYIDNIEITAQKDGSSVTPKERFVADIQGNTVGLYYVRTLEAGQAAVTTSSNKISESQLQVGKRYSYEYTASDGTRYDIAFTIKSNENFGSSRVQFMLKYLAGTESTDPCESKKPVQWKVTFTSYDADEYGRVTDQISVDPESGRFQQITVPFNIVCASKSELKKEEKKAEEEEAIQSVKIGDTVLQEDAASSVALGMYSFRVAVPESVTGIEIEETGGAGFAMIDRIDATKFGGRIEIDEARSYSLTIKAYKGDLLVDENKYIIEAKSATELEPEPSETGLETFARILQNLDDVGAQYDVVEKEVAGVTVRELYIHADEDGEKGTRAYYQILNGALVLKETQKVSLQEWEEYLAVVENRESGTITRAPGIDRSPAAS